MHSVSKNILFFQRSISLLDGGVPRVTDVISKEMVSRGHRCYYSYYQNDNDTYASASKLKLNPDDSFTKTRKLVLDFIATNKIEVIICQNADSFRFIRIYKAVRNAYPDLVFVRFLHASPDYWKMSSTSATSPLRQQVNRIKSMVRNLVYSVYHPYIAKTRALYRISNKFVLLSDTFKDSFTELYLDGKSSGKLATIPNPLTFGERDCLVPTVKTEKVVLIVSRLDENQKRISLALDVWRQLAPNVKAGWKLVIVGAGPSEESYKSLVADAKMHDVEFAGHQWNVLEYYKRASIFLMTSTWEGFPMSLLEAQQNGTVPVVFDTFSAVTDIVTNNVDGFVIQDNDVQGFSSAVSRLMQDKFLRTKMSKQAILSSHRFEVGRVADMWDALLTK